jgi:hypothetical protein
MMDVSGKCKKHQKHQKIHRSVVSAVPLSMLHEQSHHQEVASLIVPPIHTVYTHVVHAFCLAFLALKHVQICLVYSMYLS